MKPLVEASYREFARLKFLDFFPRTEHYVEEFELVLEAGIGNACFEGYGYETAFFSRDDSPGETAEIQLSFSSGHAPGQCPAAEGNAFLDQLGLKIRSGMSAAEVKQALTGPNFKLLKERQGDPAREIPASFYGVAGEASPYYIHAMVMEPKGLINVWICRKDWADEVYAVRGDPFG